MEEECEECGEKTPIEDMEFFEGRHLCDDCIEILKNAKKKNV